MRMKNPPHPGEHVRNMLDELELDVSEVAVGLGISRQQLHNLLAGRSGITAAMAVKLEAAFGSTAETWLALQAAYDLAQARQGADTSLVPNYAARQAS